LGIEHDYFSRVLSILVYPFAFRTAGGGDDPDEFVHDRHVATLGQAWYRGPVILDWESVLAGGRNYQNGRSVVLHEFAHQLDFLDGLADGTPPLHSEEAYRRWHRVMTDEYNRLIRESEKGHATLLDSYGTTNAAEFFAVATECFFEQGLKMERRHPQLYAVLRDYYNQDPAAWFAREKGVARRRADMAGEQGAPNGAVETEGPKPYRGQRTAGSMRVPPALAAVGAVLSLGAFGLEDVRPAWLRSAVGWTSLLLWLLLGCVLLYAVIQA
jgi:hypothetical protein